MRYRSMVPKATSGQLWGKLEKKGGNVSVHSTDLAAGVPLCEQGISIPVAQARRYLILRLCFVFLCFLTF
jgi:hypothetical protein